MWGDWGGEGPELADCLVECRTERGTLYGYAQHMARGMIEVLFYDGPRAEIERTAVLPAEHVKPYGWRQMAAELDAAEYRVADRDCCAGAGCRECLGERGMCV